MSNPLANYRQCLKSLVVILDWNGLAEGAFLQGIEPLSAKQHTDHSNITAQSPDLFPQFPISLVCQNCCKPLPKWTEKWVAKRVFFLSSLIVLMRKPLHSDWSPWVRSVSFSPLECVTVITTRGDGMSFNKHTGSQIQRWNIYLVFSWVTVTNEDLRCRHTTCQTVIKKLELELMPHFLSFIRLSVTRKTNVSYSILEFQYSWWILRMLQCSAWLCSHFMLHSEYTGWWSQCGLYRMTHYFLHIEERKQNILPSFFSFCFHLFSCLSHLLFHSPSSSLIWQLHCLCPGGSVLKSCHITSQALYCGTISPDMAEVFSLFDCYHQSKRWNQKCCHVFL